MLNRSIYQWLLTGLLAIGLAFPIQAQINLELQLAREYFSREEYDKAAGVFEKLFDDPETTQEVYKDYLTTLLILNEFKTAEKAVKKMRKLEPENPVYQVDMGYVYIKGDKESKGEEEYEDAIKNLYPDKASVVLLANAFMAIQKYDLALETYHKGNQFFNGFPYFNFEIAGVYHALGDLPNMVEAYLDYLAADPGQKQSVQNALQNTLEKDAEFRELQTQLYKRIQKYPDDPLYPELLIWHFIQRKDFNSAFTQVKALDKRFRENGHRVIQLAKTAYTEEAYDAAESAYEYVISKGRTSPMYVMARRGLLEAKKAKLTQNDNYNIEEIQSLEEEYKVFIDDYGKNNRTLETIRDWANLKALYLRDPKSAIELLEEGLQIRGASKTLLAECKLDLGDFYLIMGDVWESTLLYSQVDKAMKEDALGEEARYRNAKLSYYKGEFEWAQAQLDVLKGSTSELIANDALDLSVFIMDHLGLDSTEIPMQLFARAELLIFQNRNDDAMVALDTILQFYPDHDLSDDIYFAKANISKRKLDYQQTAKYLQETIDFAPEGILADDAIFMLAEINEQQLDNKAKAQELYEKIILDYKGSLYSIEARKRFRKLRGDQYN